MRLALYGLVQPLPCIHLDYLTRYNVRATHLVPNDFSLIANAMMGWITMFPWWARDGNINFQPYHTYLIIIEDKNY